MPKFEKSPQWLVDLFDGQIADLAAERRLMFGYPAAFANGQLACGLFADGMMVRLPEDERARLLALPGAQVFDPMGGRPMKEYALLPPDLLEDEEAVHGWMEKAVAYAASLPPKAAAKGKAKAAAKPRKAAATKKARRA
jgi:TfoX/Sxy family transcriptional regulator of competence genes